jgi:hypothetical protein
MNHVPPLDTGGGVPTRGPDPLRTPTNCTRDFKFRLPVRRYCPAGTCTTPPPALCASSMALWMAAVAEVKAVGSALYGGAVTL